MYFNSELVDLRVMAMKRCSIIVRSPEHVPHHQIQLSVMPSKHIRFAGVF